MPCEEIEAESPNTVPVFREDDRARQMLKVAYNVSRHGSAEQLLTSHNEEEKCQMLHCKFDIL